MLSEERIERALQEAAKGIEPSPQLWERIRGQVPSGRPHGSLGRVAVAVAAMVLLGGSLLTDNSLARFLYVHQPNPSEIASSHPLGEPQEPLLSKARIQSLTMDQAREQANFRLAVPDYLPKGARLRAVQMMTDDLGQRVIMQYELEHQTLTFQQWKTDHFRAPYVPGDTSQRVEVGKSTGWMNQLETDDGTMHWLLWEKDEMSYAIHSTFSADEIVKVARSLALQE